MNKKQKAVEQERLQERLAHFGAVIAERVGELGPIAETQPIELPRVTGMTSLLAVANHIASTTPEEIGLPMADGTEVPLRSPKTGGPMGYVILNAAVRTCPTLGKVECEGGVDKIYAKGHAPADAQWERANSRRAAKLAEAGF